MRPKFTPLQSRLPPSVIATILLFALCISVSTRSFAYASEVPLVPAHAGLRPPEELLRSGGEIGVVYEAEEVEETGSYAGGYEGDFAYFDRGLIGRAVPDGAVALTLGEKRSMEADKKTTKYFVLEKAQIQSKRGLFAEEDEGEDVLVNTGDSAKLDNNGSEAGVEKRQAGKRVYISVNTCRQPIPATGIATEDPPKLTLYVSTSDKNQKPGPDAKDDLAADPIELEDGAASLNLTTNSDIYLGVEAPDFGETWQGSFRYEVAVSTEGYFHNYDGTDPFLFLIDTDSNSALFITHNLTVDRENTQAMEKWLNLSDDEIPFTMYAFSAGAWAATGLEHSYCGIKEAFQNDTNIKVTKDMTKRYGNDGIELPKGQFHVEGLRRDQEYTGYLVMDGNISTAGLDLGQIKPEVGGGGLVWKRFNWRTKADDSCQVIFNLPFCTDIAYAVPSSPDFANKTSDLMKKYDDKAREYYKNFQNSLAQVACDTTSTAQYSLARTCADCERDYKAWMCSVLMPRCESFDTPGDWLVERNINAKLANGSIPYQNFPSSSVNASDSSSDSSFDPRPLNKRRVFTKSRNPMIDDEIKPGPYKELLPCEDLCFDIVRSCPAQLGFKCPNGRARELQYGKREREGEEGNLTCNFPGAVKSLNTVRAGGSVVVAHVGLAVSVALLAAWL